MDAQPFEEAAFLAFSQRESGLSEEAASRKQAKELSIAVRCVSLVGECAARLFILHCMPMVLNAYILHGRRRVRTCCCNAHMGSAGIVSIEAVRSSASELPCRAVGSRFWPSVHLHAAAPGIWAALVGD